MQCCNAILKGDCVSLKFGYDLNLIKYIKGLHGKSYDPSTKEWTIPFQDYNFLKQVFSQYMFNEMVEKEKVINRQYENHFNKDEFDLKYTPTDDQIEMINLHINKDKSFNASMMRTGKTFASLCSALWRRKYCGLKHCLIIVPNSLVCNWEKEILDSTNEIPFVLKGKFDDRYFNMLDLPENFFIITNVETLRQKKHENLMMDAIQYQVNAKNIDMFIMDEVHKQYTYGTATSKALTKLNPKYVIMMSGTPITNGILDLYIPLSYINATPLNYYQYKMRYCIMGGYMNKQVIGYMNTKELQDSFAEVSVRFTRKYPKQDITEYVEMGEKQQAIYNEIVLNTYKELHKIKRATNPLSMMTQLRQTTGSADIVSDCMDSAKLDRMKELVDDLIANNEKVVIFSIWTKMTDRILEMLKEYNPLEYTGNKNIQDRERAKELFVSDPKYKVLVGTTSCMSEGITLANANNVIFVDEPWTRALKDQASSRVVLPTKTDMSTIYTIVCKNTIDETVHNLVYKKGKLSDKIIDDGEVDTQLEIVNDIFEKEIEYGNLKRA